MTRRPAVPVIAATLACIGVVGCGDDAPAPLRTPAALRSGDYGAAGERLLRTPVELVAVAADELERPAGERLSAVGARELAARARRELADFQGLPLQSRLLRRQRARLVSAYRPVLRRMRAVAAALGQGDRALVRRRTALLVQSIGSLPSAASPS